jgi:hypothetical protein
VHGVDAAIRDACGDAGIEGRGRLSEADLLAFHIAHGGIDAEACKNRVATGLGPVDEADARDEEDGDDREERPALSAALDHLAEGVDQRRGDHEHREDVQEVREDIRVLERMRRVRVEKAAAIGAELLDRLLAGDGAERDGLPRSLQRRRVDRTGKRLG